MSARRAAMRRALKAEWKAAKCGHALPEPLTFWNGQPTPARRVRVRVGSAVKPTWWCAPLAGTVRAAVEVTYGDERFFLDNEDGGGWRKVTIGRGSPNYGHKSLPQDSVIVEDADGND